MKKISLLLIISAFTSLASAQSVSFPLDKNWQFRKLGSSAWHKATVPGTVHTDLLANKLIPDPFYRDNEGKVQWVEKEDWEYQVSFDAPPAILKKKNIDIEFDGLDTHADVFLNGKLIIRANNMFRQWRADVKAVLKPGKNLLFIKFYSSAKIAQERKGAETIPYPDTERIYVRKAQYQFGWDWGPRLVTAGIWKDARIIGYDTEREAAKESDTSRQIELVTEKDAIGETFYFKIDGKPTFIKGTNWIPADSFLPRAKKLKLYEQLIKAAKEANINMIRVWGGGVYEDDIFYELCDKYDIMVWQDFMFAGAMYPGDADFLNNVAEEVRYQVKRLRHHRSIVLWCGNNEIDEAWHNWGWQKQHGYSVADSAKLWQDYKKVFHEMIPGILKELDPGRPYWSSSPSVGWGRDSAYKKGDVHYWGVWWGKEPVEKYKEKVGRFVSEYGMEAMPDMKTINQFSLPQDLDTASKVMKTHQKHPYGYENIKYYIDRKFKTPSTFENLVYVSQLMQADATKIAIEAHRGNKPVTMGTMFWQWNDCWPVVSWSTVDYYGRKKAMFYEVKRDYEDVVVLPSIAGDEYQVKVISDLDSALSFSIEADYIDFKRGAQKTVRVIENVAVESNGIFALKLDKHVFNQPQAEGCWVFRLQNDNKTVTSNILFLADPKALDLQKSAISYKVINENTLEIASDKFAYGVFIDVPDGVTLEDNYFHLLPNRKRTIRFTSAIPKSSLINHIKIKSLVDTY